MWAYIYVVHITYSANVLGSFVALQLHGEGLGFAFVTDLVKVCFVRSSCAKVVRFLIEPLIIFVLI